MSKTPDDKSVSDLTKEVASINVKDESAIQKARDAGWVQPQKYDYDTYNAGPTSKEERDAAEGIQDLPAWAANAAKYEWKDEYGDVAPAFKTLEDELFNNEHINRVGLEFSKLTGIAVTFESQTQVQPVYKFEDAALHPVMLENIKLCKYEIPTPIQAYCIPSVLKGHDVIGVAQTGSGKTAAFLIPAISKLMGKAKKLAAPRPNLTGPWNPATDSVRAEPLILVVAPTRELATQIFDEARRLCYRSMLRPCVVYGGAPVREQMDELRKGCDVLVATPGRLLDFMDRGPILSLHRVKYTIIDEADEMVSPDWLDDMTKIMGGGDTNEDADHLYMMFSATFPKEARVVAKEYMSTDHVRIRVGRIGSVHANVTQHIIFVEDAKKRDCLYDLMLSMPPTRSIIFVNNKKSADFLDDFIYNKGLPSTSIHSDRTQREREDAIRAFKSGKTPILIATGVSARGLDIKNVMHVINYDLPSTDHGGIQEYVHRIGRTARIGNVGLATSFYNERNEDLAPALVRTLLETNQAVPEFLDAYKPEDVTKLDFDDDTDNEGENEAGETASVKDDIITKGADADADAGWNAPPAVALGKPAKKENDWKSPPAVAWEKPAKKDADDWKAGGDQGGW